MDERRGRPQVDIPPESDQAPLPGGEPPAHRTRPPATGDPVVDADPTASDGMGGRPEEARGTGPVRGDDGAVEPPREWHGPDTGVTPQDVSPPTAGTAGPDLGEDALGGVAGAAIGAVAGAAAGGPAGAIVGAIVGAVGGAAVTEAAADPAARGGAVADRPVDPAARDEAQPALGAAGRDLQGSAGTWTAAVSNARPIEETPVPGSEPGPNAGDERTVIDEEDPPAPPGGIERMV